MLFAAMAMAVALPNTYKGQEPFHYGPTLTPIKHVVVLYQENISFDHYFGTYPYATNPGMSRNFMPPRIRRGPTIS